MCYIRRTVKVRAYVVRVIERLPLPELRALDAWIHDRVAELVEQASLPDREALEEVRQGAITYRRERVRCGKPTCKCAAGALHGPYWYAYSRKNGRAVSKYIGKTRPRKHAP